jgi:AAA domain
MILPRLTAFSVHSFRPIFSADVSLSLSPGPNLILGGNGLGKTTLMQSVVYALCGGSEPQDEKRFRWDHSYFRARLSATESADAAVDVAFTLRDTTIQITRSLSGGRIAALAVNGEALEGDLDTAYGDVLRRYGGYQTPGDFAAVVTRLLYLPESRRLLAWDLDTQLRLLMLINDDVVPDASFYRRRALLKNLDTRKRHTRVAINKAGHQLESLLAFDENASDEDEDEPSDASAAEVELREALTRLQPVVARRHAAQAELDSVTSSLASISTDIEALRTEIEKEEAALVQNFLGQAERETSLALQKLMQRAICPACGSRQERLQAEAIARSREHLCVLCESDLPFEESGTLATLQSQLAERLRAQAQLEAMALS